MPARQQPGNRTPLSLTFPLIRRSVARRRSFHLRLWAVHQQRLKGLPGKERVRAEGHLVPSGRATLLSITDTGPGSFRFECTAFGNHSKFLDVDGQLHRSSEAFARFSFELWPAPVSEGRGIKATVGEQNLPMSFVGLWQTSGTMRG
ncbi:hypothetical protein GJAV_G00158680 [Gymnothorax javanicus]|nr:hypothetical protein GJAV_G00158680 [Gymnothorax javanicus]